MERTAGGVGGREVKRRSDEGRSIEGTRQMDGGEVGFRWVEGQDGKMKNAATVRGESKRQEKEWREKRRERREII